MVLRLLVGGDELAVKLIEFWVLLEKNWLPQEPKSIMSLLLCPDTPVFGQKSIHRKFVSTFPRYQISISFQLMILSFVSECTEFLRTLSLRRISFHLVGVGSTISSGKIAIHALSQDRSITLFKNRPLRHG